MAGLTVTQAIAVAGLLVDSEANEVEHRQLLGFLEELREFCTGLSNFASDFNKHMNTTGAAPIEPQEVRNDLGGLLLAKRVGLGDLWERAVKAEEKLISYEAESVLLNDAVRNLQEMVVQVEAEANSWQARAGADHARVEELEAALDLAQQQFLAAEARISLWQSRAGAGHTQVERVHAEMDIHDKDFDR